MPRSIVPVPLTSKSFEPFGDVIAIESTQSPMIINQGNTHRFHDLAKLTLTDAGGKASVSIFRSTPLPIPLTLKSMERHPLSSQAFYPLSGFPFLVAVAPPGELDASAIEVFLASPNQGVNYYPGTWHHYCLALGTESNFLVIDRVSDDENCDEVDLPVQTWLHIDLTRISRT